MRLYIALFSAFLLFLIDLLYQLSIFKKLSWEDGFRWVKNNLACTLFMLIFFPIAIGIFTTYLFLLFLSVVFFIISIIFLSNNLILTVGSIISFVLLTLIPVLSQFKPEIIALGLNYSQKIFNNFSLNDYILFNCTNLFTLIIILFLILPN
ncbi:hypothetical protein cce_4138 [Crocosphaera subtropica ATCC 51142]|uniref:Uncharacterized protein n=1 Tax=Crocosphaera subtropica (strain ATCC 51142 / BH68) TaxID=43989 RepID=B1WRP5_CROS5|nr:hypothetical protein cce_4138 [Crocosphaera subtropica ATCC 51142]